MIEESSKECVNNKREFDRIRVKILKSGKRNKKIFENMNKTYPQKRREPIGERWKNENKLEALVYAQAGKGGNLWTTIKKPSKIARQNCVGGAVALTEVQNDPWGRSVWLKPGWFLHYFYKSVICWNMETWVEISFFM